MSTDTTVEGVKILIARAAGIRDFNRVGLFDPTTQKTFKNRKAEIGSLDAVMKKGELLVKDLGMDTDQPPLSLIGILQHQLSLSGTWIGLFLSSKLKNIYTD